jgi:hypothetical protein
MVVPGVPQLKNAIRGSEIRVMTCMFKRPE